MKNGIMEKIDEKLRALQIAVDCIHSVNSVVQENNKVDLDILRLLSELKVDVLDIQEQQEWHEQNRREMFRAMALGGYDDNGPARGRRRGAPYDSPA